jgi:hypothetical protein
MWGQGNGEPHERAGGFYPMATPSFQSPECLRAQLGRQRGVRVRKPRSGVSILKREAISGHARACVSRTALFRWKRTQFDSLWSMTIGLTNNRVDRIGDAQWSSFASPHSSQRILYPKEEWHLSCDLCFAHELTRVRNFVPDNGAVVKKIAIGAT